MGFDEGNALREALAAMQHEAYDKKGREAKLEILQALLRQPQNFIKHEILSEAALMPDARQGYGLPIGGVLATEKSVIPYAVGVDIGCRMALSVFDFKADFLERQKRELLDPLRVHTFFGAGKGPDQPMEDEAPIAYKDIWEVMAQQEDLVDIVGKFSPKIVRMAGD